MKAFDSRNPNREYIPPAFALPMDSAVFQSLSVKARPAKPTSPSAQTLIAQLPEVVAWLREGMVARGVREEGGGGGKPGSKPPFRVAFMAAADREVECAAYWSEYFGLELTSRAWRVNGVVRGVASDDLSVVYELVDKLVPVLDAAPSIEGLLNDPRWGLWTVRAGHFAIWPQLAALFQTDRFDQPEVSDQLELM